MATQQVRDDQIALTNLQEGRLVNAAGAVSAIKDNLTAGAAPTANDDSGDGYAIGSLWIYGSNVYVATAVDVGAAAWRQIYPASASLDSDLEAIAAISRVRGDLMVANSTPAWTRLPAGSANRALKMNSAGTDPEWGVLPVAGGGTGQTSFTANRILVGNGADPVQTIAPSSTPGLLLQSNGSSFTQSVDTTALFFNGDEKGRATFLEMIPTGMTSAGVSWRGLGLAPNMNGSIAAPTLGRTFLSLATTTSSGSSAGITTQALSIEPSKLIKLGIWGEVQSAVPAGSSACSWFMGLKNVAYTSGQTADPRTVNHSIGVGKQSNDDTIWSIANNTGTSGYSDTGFDMGYTTHKVYLFLEKISTSGHYKVTIGFDNSVFTETVTTGPLTGEELAVHIWVRCNGGSAISYLFFHRFIALMVPGV